MDRRQTEARDPLVPNATTRAAIGAARRGELDTAGAVDDVFKQLCHEGVAE